MRAKLRWVLACWGLVVASAACAQDIKPPIVGLISMGPYSFVAGDNEGGQPKVQPRNRIAALRGYENIFSGIVIVATWQQLQPRKDGPLRRDAIDNMLNQIRSYNARHEKKLSVKLRVWGGYMAPLWAKRLNVGIIPIQDLPIHVSHTNVDQRVIKSTLGMFWTKEYREKFAKLQDMLADAYDNEELIREVAITQCMSLTSEPFFLPTAVGPNDNVIPQLTKYGFTSAQYKDCLMKSVHDYKAWKRTRLVLAVNPYPVQDGSDDGGTLFTAQVMGECRAVLGPRCVLDNHDLRWLEQPGLDPLYAIIKDAGPEIEFQTFTPNPDFFAETIMHGVRLGATGIELYQDYGGFACVPQPVLRQWARWLETGVIDGPVLPVPPPPEHPKGSPKTYCPPAVAPVAPRARR